MIIRKIPMIGGRYGFDKICGIRVVEHVFRKGESVLGMAFTNKDRTLLIPGFYINDNGVLLSCREIANGAKFNPYPPKEVLRKALELVFGNPLKTSEFGGLKNPAILLCFNEGNGQIGAAIENNNGWEPVVSYTRQGSYGK